MSPAPAECSYEKLISSEDNEELQTSPSTLRARKDAGLRQKLYHCLWITGRLFFLISYLIFVILYLDSRGHNRCLLGQETIFENVQIEYEDVEFQRAGFHDVSHDERTMYEGRPDLENNKAWERLMSVGIVSISEQENSKLSNSSARSRQNPQEHIVELEMFHQLHCLKSLRKQLWDFEDSRREEKDASRRQNHFDHCIDYLRQVIMCHGDLTPIMFEWNEEIDGYLATHGTLHTCRNFDAIFDWASERNTAGMSIDGPHENIELSRPSDID